MFNVARKQNGRGVRKGARWLLAFWGTVGLGILVDTGCTVTKDNYELMSFFFDGVPDPSTIAGGAARPGDATLMAMVVSHKPFAENKCEACHKTRYRPSRNDGSACLGCHDKVMTQHAWTHGAVAGGACLWCHSPHESARRWLLRGPDRKVCALCHAATLTDGSTVPAHADETMSCVACHFGHGGDNSLMLKPGATATTVAPEAEVERTPVKDPSAPATEDAGQTQSGEEGAGADEKGEPASSDAPAPASDSSATVAPAPTTSPSGSE